MARRRDHGAEYRAEVTRAHRRGFSSPHAMRKAGRYPKDLAAWKALPKQAQKSRAEALSIQRQARRDDAPVESVAADRAFPKSDLHWWVDQGLGPTRHCKTYATEADELLRVRPIALDHDVTFVATRTSGEAELADHIWDVQWRYVNGRATQAELDRLPRTFRGRPVVRDGPELLQLGLAGRFADLPEIYGELFGSQQ